MGDDEKATVVDRPGSGRTPDPHAGRIVEQPATRVAPERTSVGRYESGDEIARGGMGRVVEATDTLLGRVVAVKEALTSDPESLRRFARETRITARLEHPSIVPVYDAGGGVETPFYVMRRVTGRPLSDLIVDVGTLGERLALIPHLLAAAQAVAHAHSRGIIHRDIKPANILVGEHGETVVIDWGLAKVIGEADDPFEPAFDAGDSLRTRVGTVFGTPGFMSPEQLRGDPAGARSDVYALGASLYYLLAARPPHHAKTSDEMMSLAASGPPAPVDDLVAGIPAELSTIVDTALAFDETRCYPDANAFAEDLRRFSTGQLVASHRYSTRERLVRFIKRHRGAVAIGALALVVLAAVGTIAIRSVLAERDRADAQAALATAQQQSAEASRAMAQDRAEQLLLLRARALVATNPTAAVALLKQLSPTSARAPDAIAIANAAAIRGVGRAMPATMTYSTIAELDQQGGRLLQITLDGMVRVWDLALQKTVFEKQFSSVIRGIWVLDGSRVLLYEAASTWLLDPVTGALEPAGLPPIHMIDVDDRGLHAIAYDDSGTAFAIDLSTHTARAIWPGHVTETGAIAGDGSWVAVSDKDLVVVFEFAGAELTRHAGTTSQLVASRGHHLALLDSKHVFETVVAKGSVWSELDVKVTWAISPIFAGYCGEELEIMMSTGHVLSQRNGRLVERARFDMTSSGFREVADDYLVFASTSSNIIVFGDWYNATINLPQPMVKLRLAVRRGKPRLAVVGEGAIVVVDLEGVLPSRIPLPRYYMATVVADDLLFLQSAADSKAAWYEPSTQTVTTVAGSFSGVTDLVAMDRNERRVMISEMDQRGKSVIELRRANQTRRVFSGTEPWGVLVPGDAAAFADKTAISGRVGDQAPHKLAELEGRIDHLVALGRHRFAAISILGELIRGDVESGALERIKLDVPPLRAAMADPEGRLVLGWGRRLLRWDAGIVELATFDSEIRMIQVVEGGVFCALVDGSEVYVEPKEHGAVRRLSSHHDEWTVSADGHLVAIEDAGGHEMIELPSFVRWPTPMRSFSGFPLQLAPSKRYAIQGSLSGYTWKWQLGSNDPDLTRKLDGLTNAIEDGNGVLVWPWQDRTFP